MLNKDLNIFKDPKLDHLSYEAKDLMHKLLCRDVSQRITAKQALDHQWLSLFRTGARLPRDETLDKSRQQGQSMLGKVSS